MPFRLLLVSILTALFFSGCQPDKLDPRSSAELFFTQCAKGNIEEAYNNSSTRFQLGRSKKYFAARVRDIGLDKITTTAFGPREDHDGAAEFQVTVTTSDNVSAKLFISLIEETGKWRVAEVRNNDRSGEDIFAVMARSFDAKRLQEGSFPEPVAQTIPPIRQLQAIVEKTLLQFNEAFDTGNFDEVYRNTAERWRFRGKTEAELNYLGSDPVRRANTDPENKENRLTKEILVSNFKAFVDVHADIGRIAGKPMVLDERPIINSDGMLCLVGHYDEIVFQGTTLSLHPMKLFFRLGYFFEGGSWKLMEISLRLDPVK